MIMIADTSSTSNVGARKRLDESSSTFPTFTRLPMVWLNANPAMEETLELIRRRRKTKKRVLFNRGAFLEHDGGLELNEEERQFVWYTRKEIQKMRSESKEMARETRVSTDSFCIRGLEDAIARNSFEKKARKSAVIQGVLNEQKRQRRKGEDDLQKIRHKSRIGSKDSVKLALHMAEVDANEVRAPGAWSRSTPAACGSLEQDLSNTSISSIQSSMVTATSTDPHHGRMDRLEPSPRALSDIKSYSQQTKAFNFVRKNSSFRLGQNVKLNDKPTRPLLVDHQRGIDKLSPSVVAREAANARTTIERSNL